MSLVWNTGRESSNRVTTQDINNVQLAPSPRLRAGIIFIAVARLRLLFGICVPAEDCVRPVPTLDTEAQLPRDGDCKIDIGLTEDVATL